jgi:Domain of unknown function DUF11/Calx-beta domain
MDIRFFVAALLSASFAWADTTTGISLASTGSAVTQDFNTLVATGTGTLAANTPSGVGFVESGNGGNTTITAGTGSANAGDTYSFGAASAVDRALGALQSGTVIPTLGLRFINNTGVTLTSVQIAYTGEQWRLGTTARADRLDFQYQINATSLTAGTWIDFDTLDFTAPVTAGTVGALDGNLAANRTALTQTITGLSIAPAAEFWVRWTDFNATGADDGLGVDDFSITAIAPVALPTLTIANSLVAETSVLGSDTNLDFTLTLSAPAPAGGVSGTFSSSDGSGVNAAVASGISNQGGNDYAPQSNVAFSIAAGATNAIISVPVRGDITYEIDEVFNVTLNATGLTGATLGAVVSAVGRINNDDAVPVLQVTSPIVTEGTGPGTTTMTFNLSLDRPTQLACNFSYETFENATATGGGVDYDNLTGATVSFNATNQTASANVNIIRDAINEGTETFALDTFGEPFDCDINQDNAVGSILDDDALALPLLSIDSVSATEGNNLTFTLSLSATAAQAVSGTISTSNGTASAGSDYTALNNVPFSIGVGSTSTTVTVLGLDDAIYEAAESFNITINAAALSNATLGGATGTGTMTDDEALPEISFNSVTQAEGSGGGTTNFVFTATLNIAAQATFDYTVSTSDNSAVSSGANADFAPLQDFPLSFGPGVTTRTVTVLVNADNDIESDETFFIFARQDPLQGPPTNNLGIGTIVNDDVAVAQSTTLSISDAPDPSLVGQPYTINVSVTAATGTPAGTVSVSDGTQSCAPITLNASGQGSCQLTNNVAALVTLSANFTPADSALFAASSGSTTHQVNPGVTTLTLNGPARARINQAIAFSAALNVVTPALGAPSGTITLTSIGSPACSYSVPANSSCNMSWNSLGAKTINASFVPSDGNFLASSSNIANTFVFALADLDVSLSNQVSSYQANQILIYTLVLNNRGPDFAPGVRLQSALPSGLLKARWTCAAVNGAVCPEAGGVQDINALVLTLPANSQLIYTLSGAVPSIAPPQIRATATVSLPADGTIEDPLLTNQSATDTDFNDAYFRNGFED